MRTRFVGMTSAVVSLVALTALAFGQISLPVIASIPFAFTVQGKQLPAGKYSLQSDSGNPSIVVIRSESQRGTPLVVQTTMAQTEHPSDQAKLVFDKIGGKYFLSQIWPGNGDEIGRQVPEKRAEIHWLNTHESVSAGMPQQTTVPCSTR